MRNHIKNTSWLKLDFSTLNNLNLKYLTWKCTHFFGTWSWKLQTTFPILYRLAYRGTGAKNKVETMQNKQKKTKIWLKVCWANLLQLVTVQDKSPLNSHIRYSTQFNFSMKPLTMESLALELQSNFCTRVGARPTQRGPKQMKSYNWRFKWNEIYSCLWKRNKKSLCFNMVRSPTLRVPKKKQPLTRADIKTVLKTSYRSYKAQGSASPNEGLA